MEPTTCKDLNKEIKRLEKKGWTYSKSGKHIKLFPPQSTGAFVVVGKSTSDRRVVYNLKKDLRKVVGAMI